jgi:hypothetical protein
VTSINIKSLTLFLILYISLILGFLFNENLNFGSYYDWINVYMPPIKDFSINFYETLLGFEKYGQRHSPFYIIFLSIFYKFGLDFEAIRLIHMHLSLLFVFLFYNCLKLRFKNTDKFSLQLLSMFILISPTFRSLSIWPDSRLPGLILFVLSIYFFLKFLKKGIDKKFKFAFLSAFSLILSSYTSPNFSLFALFYYVFFLKELSNRKFIFLTVISIILALPMFYYIFILEVNFIMAGKTPGHQGSIAFSFNLSNKILIISSILFFHLFPIIYFLTEQKKFILFVKNKILFFSVIFIVLTYFFDYQINFTGGGLFYQLSFLLFKNNILFYCLTFYALFYICYISSLDKINFSLIFILIISNIQNSIYHKYYEPLILIMVFLLFENLNFNKFFSKKIYLVYIYVAGLLYVVARVVKVLYLL